MFLLNIGSRWNLAEEVNELEGGILLASSNPNVRFTRKAPPQLGRLMIDPQLYLAGLDRHACTKVCGRLASHPWFMVPEVPEFDSGEQKQMAWQREVEAIASQEWPGKPPTGDDIEVSCRAAIECQIGFGCSHVILPSPLLDDQNDAATIFAQWLDAGLAMANQLEVGQPLLATIALNESTLTDSALAPAGFLDALVDHLSARDGFGGAYVVIAQGGSAVHPFNTGRRVNRAYLHLSRALRAAGLDVVLVNFADVFGFVCAGLGATDIATGQSQSMRRLSLGAFRDEGGGIAVPHFYSHRAIGEFATQSDLDPVVEGGLLRRITDLTSFSDDLLDALGRGQSASSVPSWAESQNNLASAQRHFVCRLAIEGDRIRQIKPTKRKAAVRDWLEDALASVLLIRRRMKDLDVGRFAPSDIWLELLDEE